MVKRYEVCFLVYVNGIVLHRKQCRDLEAEVVVVAAEIVEEGEGMSVARLGTEVSAISVRVGLIIEMNTDMVANIGIGIILAVLETHRTQIVAWLRHHQYHGGQIISQCHTV